ncbi:Collagen alpha-1(XIV) chain [Schistosoma japonicum]|nr:Collagen alpha-1(XIV) chain [Schistosoma japonicum]
MPTSMFISWNLYIILLLSNINRESSANNTTTITTTTNYPVGSTFEPSSSDVDTSTTIATTRSTMHAITSVGVIQSESSANNTTTITTTTNYPVGSTFEPSSSDVDTSTTIATTRSTMHAITSVGVIQSGKWKDVCDFHPDIKCDIMLCITYVQ